MEEATWAEPWEGRGRVQMAQQGRQAFQEAEPQG